MDTIAMRDFLWKTLFFIIGLVCIAAGIALLNDTWNLITDTSTATNPNQPKGTDILIEGLGGLLAIVMGAGLVLIALLPINLRHEERAPNQSPPQEEAPTENSPATADTANQETQLPKDPQIAQSCVTGILTLLCCIATVYVLYKLWKFLTAT